MKNKSFLLLLTALLIAAAMLGCSGTNSGTTPGPGPGPGPGPDFSIPYDLHPLRTAVPAGFIRGADISNCWEIEQAGGKYKNFEGQVQDIMRILADNGVNYVRIRLWVDPSKHPNHYPGDGNNHIGVTKVIAARAKAAGMKFLLDYHYSDYWADPGKQQIPYAWKDLTTKDELYVKLYDYTMETIKELIEAGATPDMVQLGNEIPSGLLNSKAGAITAAGGGTVPTLGGWGDFSLALYYGSMAVREAAPGAKIMIQFDAAGATDRLNNYANFTDRVDTGASATYTTVDYDVIGLSWYPFWSSHASIDSMFSNIRTYISRYGKEVVICESGYMYSAEDFDWPPENNGVVFSPTFNDNLRNVYGTTQEESSVNLMTNTNGFTSDSDVIFAYRENGTTRYLPGTPENQARVYRAFMDAVVAAGGAGVMWWGADWFAPVYGLASNVENAALFDNTGKALPVMKVLGLIKGADVSKPGKVTGLKGTVNSTAAELSWNKVNANIASKYQLERAAAAAGPWTVLADDIAAGTYSDTVQADTAYYYRIRAYNANGWGNYSDVAAVPAN